MNIKNINNKLHKLFIYAALPFAGIVGGSLMTSCGSMLTPGSDLVEYEEDNQLQNATDSLYSVMGIVRQMQNIADRTVLLGEVRGDLLQTQGKATTSIKELAAFDIKDGNTYNNVADYYAVINNCNYYLKHVNTELSRLGKNVFEKEYAVVKAYRAWTYLQLAKVYGKVPLVVEPITTISQAELAQQSNYVDMQGICEYFISDLAPYVDTELPNYGAIGNFNNSQKFFIPVRVILGEMCLWAGEYEKSAQYFYDYLTHRTRRITTGTSSVNWPGNALSNIAGNQYGIWDSGFMNNLSNSSADEIISIIPMETSEFNGVISLVKNVYNSNRNNEYYAQVAISNAMRTLSKSQTYTQVVEVSTTEKDTTYLPNEGLSNEFANGDLRLGKAYSSSHVNQDNTSHFAADRSEIKKVNNTFITIYRAQQVYLMFAEALNRAGYPESALCILKYGLYPYAIDTYISAREKEVGANRYLNFDGSYFTANNTQGIHARGCGDVAASKYYVLPVPQTEMPSRADSLEYIIPRLEDMIVDEMGLETAFEGNRLYDIMRVAMHRKDNSYLASKISKRNSTEGDQTLYNRLLDQNNWYLPLSSNK